MPLLESNACVWKPYTLKDIDCIERVLRYFTRCISNLPSLTHPEHLHVLKFEYLEAIGVLKMIAISYLKLKLVLYVNFNCFFNY